MTQGCKRVCTCRSGYFGVGTEIERCWFDTCMAARFGSRTWGGLLDDFQGATRASENSDMKYQPLSHNQMSKAGSSIVQHPTCIYSSHLKSSYHRTQQPHQNIAHMHACVSYRSSSVQHLQCNLPSNKENEALNKGWYTLSPKRHAVYRPPRPQPTSASLFPIDKQNYP